MELLLKQFKEKKVSALSRLITLVENDSPLMLEIMDAIYPLTGKAHIIGVTGPPGAGKSTLVDKLISVYRQNECSVGVICVDPSSIFSGGAFLGDRVRMNGAYGDNAVYLRSLATRGELGGLAPKTSEIIMLLDAFGKDVIIVETVGVGQMEADIIKYTDTKLVLSVPGLGDQMQALKAGILEIADIFVVNKADCEGADDVVFDLKMMLNLKCYEKWFPEIVMTEALNNRGVSELYTAIQKHKAYITESGLSLSRDIKHLEHTCLDAVEKLIKRIIKEETEEEAIKEILTQVRIGLISPYKGANQIIRKVLNNYQMKG